MHLVILPYLILLPMGEDFQLVFRCIICTNSLTERKNFKIRNSLTSKIADVELFIFFQHLWKTFHTLANLHSIKLIKKTKFFGSDTSLSPFIILNVESLQSSTSNMDNDATSLIFFIHNVIRPLTCIYICNMWLILTTWRHVKILLPMMKVAKHWSENSQATSAVDYIWSEHWQATSAVDNISSKYSQAKRCCW